MWQCPKCSEEVDDTFSVCWSCGTATDGAEDPDFLCESAATLVTMSHIARSARSWTDFALTIGQFCAAVGCFASLWAFVAFPWTSDLARFLIVPLGFFYQLAMLAVFSRVKNL